MATTRTDDRNEALDPEAIDQLFVSVGQASRDVASRASQPTSVAAAKLDRPLPGRDSSRPTPCRLSQAEYADKVRLWRDWLPSVWLVGCLLVAGFCFLMGMPNSPLRKTTVGAAVAKYVEQEMGAVGDAYVEAILPCPPIEDGPGNVVTGVFAHEADPDTAHHENLFPLRPSGRIRRAGHPPHVESGGRRARGWQKNRRLPWKTPIIWPQGGHRVDSVS